MRRHGLYRPENGFVGDVIPFERDGEFWLYYLHEQRDSPGRGTGWDLVKTRDFVRFEYAGEALPPGGAEDDDYNAYTGSIVLADGVAHLFYTGQNPRRLGPDGRTPLQLVMHATSDADMRSWVKDPSFTFGATMGYESGDWRDPFVFRPSPEEPWRMLITARRATGPERRRGVIAQCISDDLVTWKDVPPFWDPQRYVAQECPDVFQWGDWWYLVYSEFSERFTTRYRMSRSPDGPWIVPAQDTIDGRAFYASKTVCRGNRRFFVGWISTKENESDGGAWQWAGDMSVLEALQRPDGSLAFLIPEEIENSFTRARPLTLASAGAGKDATSLEGTTRLSAPDGYAMALTPLETEPDFFARIKLNITPGTTEAGLLLRSTIDGDHAYYLRLEPKQQRMVFDRWPRASTGPMQWQVSGDVPHLVELERPCVLEPGEHQIDLFVEGTVCIAVLDKTVALTARIYEQTDWTLRRLCGRRIRRVLRHEHCNPRLTPPRTDKGAT